MPNVLFIDDEITIAINLGNRLRKSYGYDITTAGGLAEGLRVIKSGSYDFVIVDKNLGTHRGVSPLLDFLQEERPDTKVVLFSAEDGIRAKKELYCHAFVSKISVHYDNLPRNLHAAMQRVA